MTTPDTNGFEAPRVTREAPRRTVPYRGAAMAFRPPEVPPGARDEAIEHGVRSAYQVCEEYMRQGEYEAGRHPYAHPHHGGYYDGGGAGDATAMAWQLWLNMVRAWVNGPASLLGAMMPDLGGYGRPGGHGCEAPRHGKPYEPGHVVPDEHGHTKRPELSERVELEVLTQRVVVVTASLPGMAMLRDAQVREMKPLHGAEGKVTACFEWNASRNAPKLSVNALNAGEGVFVGDVYVGTWHAGTIKVEIPKHEPSAAP